MATPDGTPGRRLFPEYVWRSIVFASALAIVVVFATQWNRWEGGPGRQVTDDAYLQADLTPVAARVAGYVRQVPVQDFEQVRAGQVLAEIVDDEYRATVAEAEASVAAARAQIAALQAQRGLQEANREAARAVVASTEAVAAQNQRDSHRQHTLLSSGSTSTEATEHTDATRAQLAAQLRQNRAQEAAAARQLDVLEAQIAQAEAALAGHQAALDLARLNLAYTRITAPQDGVIGQRQVRPGQYLGVGGQVATLTPLPHLWVIANYKETQLTHIRVGEAASVTVDSFPGHVLRGRVIALSPASGSQFALLPPDNATGNFTKVVQRMAVKIGLDDLDGLADRLQAGMSVVATVEATDPPVAAGGPPK
jgi:membrane fusion protein (multidrug efflux system)